LPGRPFVALGRTNTRAASLLRRQIRVPRSS
jgi:hypothetical protein